MNKLTILSENIVKNIFLSKRTGAKLRPSGFPSFRLSLSLMSSPLKMGKPEAPGGQSQGEWWPLSPTPPPLWPASFSVAALSSTFRDFADSLLILHSCQLIPSP